jgi:rhodanese-related sulfurtransferase
VPTPSVPEVDVAEAHRRIEHGAVLLDVREAEEWDAGHAAGAHWIPMNEVAERHAELSGGHSVVVVCRSGHRSAFVTEVLVAHGFQAANLVGGMRAWAAAGHTLVADGNEPPYVL